MKIRKSIILNLRWHRRIGLCLFAFLLFLAVTGFMLNHSPGLKLGEIRLTNHLLMSWYGLSDEPVRGFHVEKNWLFVAGSDQLWLGEHSVATCHSPLRSVASKSDFLLALCADSLLLLTAEGQLIESVPVTQLFTGKPEQLGVSGDTVYVSQDGKWFLFDTDSMQLSKAEGVTPQTHEAQNLPRQLAANIEAEHGVSGISLETLLLDLHSGRFFGDIGVWIVDLLALLICVLAVTGVYSWFNFQRLRGKRDTFDSDG